MQVPVLPVSRGRSGARRHHDALDSRPEPELDEIAKLATRLCEMPTSVIVQLSHAGPLVRARGGVTFPLRAEDVALYAEAGAKTGYFVVPDTRLDEWLAQRPATPGEPQVRFCAGIRLLGNAGEPLGALCVADEVPRDLNLSQIETLRSLGTIAAGILDGQSKRPRQRLADRHAPSPVQSWKTGCGNAPWR